MSIAVGEKMTTDLIVELRRVMAAHDGNRDLMFVAGRGFLVSKNGDPDMVKAAAEFGRILKLEWGNPNDQEPWMAGR